MFLLTAYCSLRAANPLTVWMAYLILTCRVVQTIGVIIKNRTMSEISYGIIAFCCLIMFFAEFAAESADIVHESMPTAEMSMDIKHMLENYNPN